MRVTLTTMKNEVAYDVTSDMTLSDLMCLASFDLHLENMDISILRGTQCLARSDEFALTLQEAGVVDGDLLVLVPTALLNQRLAQSAEVSSSSTSATAPPAGKGIVLSAELRSALANFKVKGAGPSKTRAQMLREQATELFKRMSTEQGFRSFVYGKHKALFDQWSKAPNDLDAFAAEYTKVIEQMELENKMKSDPTSVEGQRLIQEEINRQRIEHSYQHTYEHHPEYLVRCTMLYINMEINKNPVHAFVDSGAQTSIMSEACARRCGLIDLIDRDAKMMMNGVGGQEESLGRIHACDVKIENHHFLCPFEVMRDRSVDILFGLNVLKIHQCNINLKANCLEMGDGTVTQFLSEQDVNKIIEQKAEEEAKNFVVDDEKLLRLIEMGFDRDDAMEILKLTRNDADLAVLNLYNKKLNQ